MSENKVIIRQKNSSSQGYDNVYPKGWAENNLTVTSLPGTTITLSKATTQSYTFGSNETIHSFNLDDGYGDYTVTASKNGVTQAYSFSNTFVGLHEIGAYAISKTLDSNDWGLISTASYNNIGQSLWDIGDKKSVTINGTINGYTYNTTLYVFITDFAHNVSVEGSGICFQGFKDANGKDIAICAPDFGNQATSGFIMNQSDITDGGWNGSYMKQTIIPQFKNALPRDLVNNIKTTTIWTHNTIGGSNNNNASNVTATQETVYLLAEFEILGLRGYANQYEQNHQTQYQYYKNGNSSVKYNYNSTSSVVSWWERSVDCKENATNRFCYVNYTQGAGSHWANLSNGFAPAFKV